MQLFPLVRHQVLTGVKEGDWLALSAVMVDVAGNQVISPPTYVRVMPGIDFTLENVNVDRLIVAANTGDQINVTGTVVSNQYILDLS